MIGYLSAVLTTGEPVTDDALRSLLLERTDARCWTSGPVGVGCAGDASLAVATDLVVVADGRLDDVRGAAVTGDDVASQFLALWRKFGPDAVDRVTGELAAVVVERARCRLHAIRDICAGRPLHVAELAGRRIAASDLAPLATDPALRLTPDPVWVASFFTPGFAPGEVTAFREVHEVLAGHTATTDGGRWAQTTRAHWRVPRLHRRKPGVYAERFRSLLDQAITRRGRAARSPSVALSGGLDSTSLLLRAASLLPDVPWTALSVPFEDPDGDERDLQRLAAEAANARLRWVTLEGWGPMGHAMGGTDVERYGVPAIVSNWFFFEAVAEAARDESIDVCFTGDDADSSIGGMTYLHLGDLLARGRWHAWWQEATAIRRDNDVGYRWVLEYSKTYLRPPRRRAATVRGLDLMAADIVRDEGLVQRLRDPASAIWRPGRMFRYGQAMIGTPAVIAAFVRESDRPFRARGVRIAQPFLDRDLLEFGMGLPHEHVIRRGWSKVILRQVMAGALPERIRKRPGKAALGEPHRTAIHGPQRSAVQAGLQLGRELPDWFDPTAVADLTDRFERDDPTADVKAEHLARLATWLVARRERVTGQ